MPSLISSNSKLALWVFIVITFSSFAVTHQTFQNPLLTKVEHVKELLMDNVSALVKESTDSLLKTKELVELYDEENYQQILKSLDEGNRQKSLELLRERQILRDDDHPVRPIFGVVGEALRVSQLIGNQGIDKDQYIPWAHVQLLKMASIKVYPINYLAEFDDMEDILDELNGVYLTGDGQENFQDDLFEETFEYVVDYAEKRNTADEEHFPVFLMGNSFRNLVKYHLRSDRYIQSMDDYFNTNLKLRFIHSNAEETFLGGNFTHDEVKAKLEQGEFLNRQEYGMTHSEFLRHYDLRNNYDIWATFSTSLDYVHEYIAILAHKDFPLYCFTYNLEFNLFAFADPSITSIDVIDHSVEAREHVQFVANEMWEEGIQSHVISGLNEAIDDEEIGFINYVSSFDRNKIPRGYKYQEVYFLY